MSNCKKFLWDSFFIPLFQVNAKTIFTYSVTETKIMKINKILNTWSSNKGTFIPSLIFVIVTYFFYIVKKILYFLKCSKNIFNVMISEKFD